MGSGRWRGVTIGPAISSVSVEMWATDWSGGGGDGMTRGGGNQLCYVCTHHALPYKK